MRQKQPESHRNTLALPAKLHMYVECGEYGIVGATVLYHYDLMFTVTYISMTVINQLL